MKTDMPLAMDHLRRESAKRVLCALIQKSGGRFSGQTRLYKAFYWAHLYYWEHAQGVLTAYPMARMPNGPGIHRGEDLLFEMQRENLIRVAQDPAAQFPERTFSLLAEFQVNLTPEESAAINYALAKVRDKTAAEVSEETHRRSRSWQRMRDGQVLNIYEDLLADSQFESMKQADQSAGAIVDQIFD